MIGTLHGIGIPSSDTSFYRKFHLENCILCQFCLVGMFATEEGTCKLGEIPIPVFYATFGT